jgi:hypothetical protein
VAIRFNGKVPIHNGVVLRQSEWGPDFAPMFATKRTAQSHLGC